MTTQLLQSLPEMSLAISIVVVICMGISFASLFFLYGKTKSKGVSFGVEDEQLKKELSDSLKKRESGITYTQMLTDRKKKERVLRIITDVILIVLILFAGGLAVFSFVLRSKGEQVYFGDTAYLTVLTGSMQEKNENNPYLKENDDGVRIHQYALIGIDKVDPAELKEGDIIAFKYEGNSIYVHRIVSVREVGGERFFTTMGDANDISSLNETNISADRIVGVFNGYHKGYLGVLLIYMRSDIGMVALIFVFLLLAVINAAEWLITRSYEKRLNLLACGLDGAGAAETNNGELSFALAGSPPEADAGNQIKITYNRSFKAKLIQSDDLIKEFYGELKNQLLKYGKVRSVISWRHEAFMFSNKGTVVKLLFRGKTLCVLLPFGEDEYVRAGIKLKSSGSGEKCLLRITGSVTLGRAVKAIEYSMQNIGAVACENKRENYFMPFLTLCELESENLVKKKAVDMNAVSRLKNSGGEKYD